MSRPSPVASSDGSSQASWTSSATVVSTNSATSSAQLSTGSGPSPTYSNHAEASQDTGYVSPYPPLPPSTTMSAGRPITATTAITSTQQIHEAQSSSAPTEQAQTLDNAQKQALINALNERRVNTIGELRRIERIFATLGSSDVTQPMTSAWVYYVNSNSLLTELRGLTRNYPFSSECVEEAKNRVHQDPHSNRSWNYCWLVLAKIHTDRLVPTYARAQASRPEMWGGRIPLAESVNQLAEAFVQEWNAALQQLLRYWENPPIR